MARTSLFWATLVSGAASLGAIGCGGSADVKFVGEPDTSFCGDGNVNTDEKCDDGNKEAGDGCSDKCAIEPGYVCTGKSDQTCAKTCGNDKVNDGETCDDGNLEKGDGCDETCQAEGSCEAPLVLDVSSGSASIDSSTASGGSFVDASDCNGDTIGAGPDRVFQIDIPSLSDVEITLSSSFNAVLRLQEAACDATAERGCVNDVGAGAEEQISFRDVAPGAYFVIVDGAADRASGDFTLQVKVTCPLSALKLTEVGPNWQGDGYSMIEVTNRSSSCSLDLSKFHLGVYQNWPTNGIVDVPLKKATLAKGKSFLISSNADVGYMPDQVATDAYVQSTFGMVELCAGTCSKTDGSNVLDLIHIGYDSGGTPTAPTLPVGVTFSPAPLQRGLSYFSSYARKKFTGKGSKFQASDWAPVVSIDPDKTKNAYGLYGTGAVSPQSITLIDDPLATEGKVLRILGGTTSGHSGYYLSLPLNFAPTSMLFRIRRPATNTNPVYVNVGQGSAGNYFDSPFDYYLTEYASYLYSNTPFLSFTETDASAAQWRTVEYRSIDWTAGTFDFYVDGSPAAGGEGLTIKAGALDILELLTFGAANENMDIAEIQLTE